MSKYQFKTTNIKGKEYVEVNERIKFFRQEEQYKGWSLSSHIEQLDSESCVIRAEIRDENWVLRATGYAQEDKSSSFINKTSYVENCETSAWGRALANLGIGIDTSIASSNEVAMAISKQSLPTNTQTKSPVQNKVSDKVELKVLTPEIKENMLKAVADGKADAVENALGKYKVTAKERKEILGK